MGLVLHLPSLKDGSLELCIAARLLNTYQHFWRPFCAGQRSCEWVAAMQPDRVRGDSGEPHIATGASPTTQD